MTGLDQFLSLKETLEMLHLPHAHDEKHGCLCKRPVEHSFVCALAGLTETLLTIALIVLFLGDLLHLIQQLTDSQLELGELLLLSHICVVDGMLADLNVEMHTKLRATKPGCRVGVHANDVLAGCVGGE